MTYIDDLLPRPLLFSIKPVGLNWGVFEQVKKEDVLLDVGCVHVNTDVRGCREYIAQRNSREELKVEEKVGRNRFIEWRARDGVLTVE